MSEPAFPGIAGQHGHGNVTLQQTDNGTAIITHNQGMSLRDYFAAAALSGILPGADYSTKDAATVAYQYADAMLAERETSRG